LRKASIVAYRLAAVASLLRRARCYRLVLGRSTAMAAEAVLSVLKHPSGRPTVN